MQNVKWSSDEFYPTPDILLEKITKNVDWMLINSILEPSAGKGNIAEFCRKQLEHAHCGSIDIDCIEIDADLRATLKGKDFRVVHDDFLSYKTFKHYDLIIMNPPFSSGAKHLLHALRLQHDNFGILCILNAETLRNPCNSERKSLVQKLQELNADIDFMKEQFKSAERPTGVEVAVVTVFIPKEKRESEFFNRLQTKYYSDEEPYKLDEITAGNFEEMIVKQYQLEVEAGIELIKAYNDLVPHILNSIKTTQYSNPILVLKVDGHDASVNAYVKEVRRKYWDALFHDRRFTSGMPNRLASSFYSEVARLVNYDFSTFNIRTMQIEMRNSLIRGIEDCIVSLFDELSYEHSYDNEIPRNIHYYNGWTSNKSWCINKKVVMPYMNSYDNWNRRFDYSHEVAEKLHDIEAALNYLDGGLTGGLNSAYVYTRAIETGQTKKVRFRFFYATFYKKGTCHIEFIDDNLLKKFNIFGSRQKGWLPQCYGRKKYTEMDEQEKAVVDSFEGEDSYQQTLENVDYFIYNPNHSMKMLSE